MNDATHATLKATGERILILGQGRPAGAAGDEPSYLCRLPPQAPGHEPRREWIRASRLRFSSGS